MIYAEALLMEYHRGEVLSEALYGTKKRFVYGLKGLLSP